MYNYDMYIYKKYEFFFSKKFRLKKTGYFCSDFDDLYLDTYQKILRKKYKNLRKKKLWVGSQNFLRTWNQLYW